MDRKPKLLNVFNLIALILVVLGSMLFYQGIQLGQPIYEFREAGAANQAMLYIVIGSIALSLGISIPVLRH